MFTQLNEVWTQLSLESDQLSMYLPTSQYEQDETQGQSSVEFHRFEFRLFLLLNRLLYELKSQFS